MDGYGSSGIGARFNRAADWLTGADAERAEGALDQLGPGITAAGAYDLRQAGRFEVSSS